MQASNNWHRSYFLLNKPWQLWFAQYKSARSDQLWQFRGRSLWRDGKNYSKEGSSFPITSRRSRFRVANCFGLYKVIISTRIKEGILTVKSTKNFYSFEMTLYYNSDQKEFDWFLLSFEHSLETITKVDKVFGIVYFEITLFL